MRGFIALTDVEHGIYQRDELAGWVTAPNLRVPVDIERPPLHFTADTNERGLRGGDPVPARVEDELRILVLGDSFTWGIGVESEDTFPAALQRRLRAETGRTITVINGGMPNYGTAEELGFYRGHADELDPDLVVLAFYWNDYDDNMVEHVYADGYLWRDPWLLLGHPSYVVEFIRRRVARSRSPDPPAGSSPRSRTMELIETLRAETEADRRPFYVLEIPPRETTRHVATELEEAAPYEPLELPEAWFIEMFDEVEAEPETPYLEEHHLNPRGHQIAAEVLARELIARGALDLE